MNVVTALVLYAVVWFMTFFVVIPFRLRTQGDEGEVVPGTHASAPEVHNLRTKAIITTLVALVIWAIIATVIIQGWISVRDFDWFNRMSPPRN